MSAVLQDKFIEALWRGNAREIEMLLNSGADVDAESSVGFTPLTQATRMRHLSSARLLLDRGARVNQPDRYGVTPLYLAVDSSIQEMLQAGGKRGEEPTQMIELLLAHGASPLIPNRFNQTPLDHAINCHSQKIVDLLKSR